MGSRRRRLQSPHRQEEVRAAAVAGDGDDVGEQAPDGLDDPGGADEPLVELRCRRLHALHVLPVVPRRDAADGVADALAGPVDGHDGEHEAPVQLAGQTPEPAAAFAAAAAVVGIAAAAAGFSKRRVVVLLLLAIHLGSDFLPGFLGDLRRKPAGIRTARMQVSRLLGGRD